MEEERTKEDIRIPFLYDVFLFSGKMQELDDNF
jgi:hypothetical protein